MIIPGFPGATMLNAGRVSPFVSATTGLGVGLTAAIQVNRPAYVAEGDLMIAVVEDSVNSNPIVPPAGWTTVYSTGTPGSFFIFRKVATASEPGVYFFETLNPVSGAHRGRVSIVAYRKPQTVNVFAASNYSGANANAPSITPTVSGVLLAIFTRYGTATVPAPIGGPGDMIQRTNDTAGGGPGIYICEKYPSSRVATGVKTMTFATSGSGHVAQMQIV